MKKALIWSCLALICRIPGFPQETLPLGLIGGRILTVKTLVNGDIESTFILDTGGGLDLVSGKFFSRIKETAKPAGFLTGFQASGSRIDAELVEIPSLQVGSYKKDKVVITSYARLDALSGIDGLISMKFFESQPFTLNFKAKTLTLETEASLAEIAGKAQAVPMFEHNNQGLSLDIFIPLLINDKIKIRAEFDTGSGLAVMIHPYFLGALGIDENSPGYRKTDFKSPDGSSQTRIAAGLRSLGVAGSTLVRQENVSAAFFEKFIYEGLVGWQFFKDTILTIDYPHRRFLIR